MHNFKAVLFDFDGTLARLTLDFKHMRALVLAELAAVLGAGHPALSRGELPVMEHIYAAAAGLDETAQAEIKRRAEGAVSAYEVEAAAGSSLFPFTKELLRGLKGHGVATGIVTRNCRAAVEKVFPEHAAFCGALVCREDVAPENLKPQPGQLWAALTALGVQPDAALMVGDHPIDIASGKAAGCATAGVLTGNATREALLAADPDWLAQDAEALFKELRLV